MDFYYRVTDGTPNKIDSYDSRHFLVINNTFFKPGEALDKVLVEDDEVFGFERGAEAERFFEARLKKSWFSEQTGV